MQNIAFVPSERTIDVGTTITWINMDADVHTVTSQEAGFDSGAMNKGDTFSHTFNSAGTFAYTCTFHPAQMNGTIIVE